MLDLYTRHLGDMEGGYRSKAYPKLQQLLKKERWFTGLSEEWEPPWCACHCLPKDAEAIPQAVDKVLAQLSTVHAYRKRLVALSQAEPPSCEPSELRQQLSTLTSETIDLAVEATGCNDAWYYEVTRALKLVLLGRGIELREPTRQAIHELVRTQFTSWIGPNESNQELVANGAAQLAVDGLFGG